MARWGNVDFRELQALQRKLQRLEGEEAKKLCEDIAKDLSKRLYRRVVKRTPVGVYPEGSGKRGGTLRNGWRSGTIKHEGHEYTIEIFNNVEYVIYVEYGHRTANHKGWVRGRFMLTISEKEIENIAPKIAERMLIQKIKEVLDSND